MQPNMTLKNSHFSGPNPADAWKPLRPDFVRGRYAGRSGHELIEKQAESRKKPEFFATVRADANFLRSRWTRQILSLVRPVPFSIGGRRTPDDGCCRCATPIPPTVSRASKSAALLVNMATPSELEIDHRDRNISLARHGLCCCE